MTEKTPKTETIYESCIALLDAINPGKTNLTYFAKLAVRERIYPNLHETEVISLLSSATEINHNDTLITHRDSVMQILTALRDEAQMRPNTLAQSLVGQMLTEVLSGSMHNGWARSDYDKARIKFEQTHKPDEKMTDLLDHGFNISQMIYTGNYPRTANIFHDLITSLSEIKAGI